MTTRKKINSRVNTRRSFKATEEAEQRILGLVLWKPERIVGVHKILTPSDFRYEKHQLIFGAKLNMRKQGTPIYVYTLWCFLKECGDAHKVGGSMYLTYLTQITFWEDVWNDENGC